MITDENQFLHTRDRVQTKFQSFVFIYRSLRRTRAAFPRRLPRRFGGLLPGLLVGLFVNSWTVLASVRESFPLRDNGTIPVWTVLGPIPVNANQIGLSTDMLAKVGGEATMTPVEGQSTELTGGARLRWQTAFTEGDGVLNFHDAMEISRYQSRLVYAFCILESAEQKEVELVVRHNDGCRAWLNQQLLVDRTHRGGPDPVEKRFTATLKAGANPLMCKVTQTEGDWGLFISVQEKGKSAPGIKVLMDSQAGVQGKFISARLSTLSLVRKDAGKEYWTVQMLLASGGVKDAGLELTAPRWGDPVVKKLGDLPLGKHRVEVEIPANTSQLTAHFKCTTHDKVLDALSIAPPKKWTVYLSQHTHTDIGYTRPQTEILPEHLRYIDYALDYCDLTDSYPDDARFRWTCETAWAVREYVERRPPGQVERLKKRLQEGRIEIAGMLLNMSEMATESSLAAMLQPIRVLKDQFGISVVTAMQNDVNGAGWCLADYFSGMGIKYLSMGINKTRSILPFDKPTTFWWESPSGKRVLAYRSDHYMTANFWQVQEGNMEKTRPQVVKYLQSLQDREYPFDRAGVQFSGYFTDNSPPSTAACDLVKKWNETYAWPQLRLSTAHEFLDYVAKQHGGQLEVHRQAWPDWWTDGFGSAARETAASRETHAALQVNSGLLAMAVMLGAPVPRAVSARIAAIQDALLFYDEHTYGAAESISDPLAENSQVQWGEKGSYAWEAVKNSNLLREEAMGWIQDYLPRADKPIVAVMNTLNGERSGLLKVFIDHEILPADKDFKIVDTATGQPIPVQFLNRRAEGTYWGLWVSAVPSLGYKSLKIEVSQNKRAEPTTLAATNLIVENRFYRLTVDQAKGAIRSLIDKETDQELVDQQAAWALGQCVYETAPNRDMVPEAYRRVPVRNLKAHAGANGPIWKSRRFTGDLDGCAEKNGFEMEVQLFETEKRLEFHFGARKLPVLSPEALYVAFPFQAAQGRLVYEGQGGPVIPGENQIPGSSSDWQTFQNYVAVCHPAGQIILGSDQAPLVQLGDFNLGKWMPVTRIKRPHVYSWVMNNYWFTNFRATQEGEFRWSYYLTSVRDTSPAAATRFGWGSRVPLVARVFAPKALTATSKPDSLTVFGFKVPNVLIVQSRPAAYGQGVILHLRELEGKTTTLTPADVVSAKDISSADEVNVLEEPIQEGIESLTLQPYEVKFLRLVF